jgi:NADH-quinone oxidoreductase subunit M
VFLALDFFHWFLFWELSLVPAFFLIKLWGGAGATRAAYQFVIYTIGGSAFMLVGFAAIYAATGTLDFIELARQGADGTLAQELASTGGWWPRAVFLGVLLGLAVKVPLWPFHTWLPSAYAEAPTGASMFLTGVMSKMGMYGFLRILWPLFPGALHDHACVLLWLSAGRRRVRRLRRDAANRSEADGRVLFAEPPQLLLARPLRDCGCDRRSQARER